LAAELELAERWDRINKVVECFLKGMTNTALIAQETGFSRNQVNEYLKEWRSVIQSDSQIQNRAKEAIGAADQHYAMLIARAWETVEQADQAGNIGAKTAALKLISDVQQKQIEMLSKAGVLENNEMAERIIETEEKQQVLVNILRDIVSDCDRCKPLVMSKLSRVSGQAENIA